MKISRKWLQKYFEEPLPSAETLAEALTFHAFEIESADEDLLDVKVLPNRAADCLSHRGIAKELSAILDVPLTNDPLRGPLPTFSKTDALTIEIENPEKCPRYIGALVKGVKVSPSPAWLREALEAVGQRSINNIVDATNYVMLDIGQPIHAFDAAKLVARDGRYSISVRAAREGERMTTLSDEMVVLATEHLVIVDTHADVPIGIAGVKGGKGSEVTEGTTDLVIESANFDGTSVRRTAQALKLPTDASARFQNRPSPEFAAYGARDTLALIREVAGGEAVDVVDVYPSRAKQGITSVSVSLTKINSILGSNFSRTEAVHVFDRLGLDTHVESNTFTISPPFERTDLIIPEDLVEEIGRIVGYEQIPATELPPVSGTPDQARFRGIERMKDQLVERGFIEVSTQSFVTKGEVLLANPLDTAKPALRTSLGENLDEALAKAKYYAPLVLSPNETPKLFEIGTVFPKEGEHFELRMTERVPTWGDKAGTVDNLSVSKLEEYGKDYEPKRYKLGTFTPFSAYPFIARDIALWMSEGTEIGEPERIIRENAGELLVRLDQFDRFEKDGRTSLAYRLVFQSGERTLTDAEVNDLMKAVSDALSGAGFEVR